MGNTTGKRENVFGRIFHSRRAKIQPRTGDAMLDGRNAVVTKYEQLLKEKKVKMPGLTINDHYFNEALDEKMILLLGLGKNVRGSMQYILNELNYDPYFKGYVVYVRTSEETEPVVQDYIAQNNWIRTKTITANGQYAKIMNTAKYLITEVFFPESYMKKPGQMYINIWHGTPLKKLGCTKNARNHHRNGVQQKSFIDADYLLYPNEYTRQHMLESYKVSNLMPGKILMCGYPRTGGFMQAAQGDLTQLKAQLAPKGEKIYAFMPTFRDYLDVETVVAQSKELLDYLDTQMDDSRILYVNLHHRVSDSIDYSGFKHIKQFPPAVDSYKLLAATEALISDYSSVFFDYLAMRKQIILYAYDYDLYKSKRGVYMELTDLPFDIAMTKEAVWEAMKRGKTYDDSEVHDAFCHYDDSNNAKKLCQLLKGSEKDLIIEEIPKTDRYKLVVYTDAFAPGLPTEALKRFADVCDAKKNDLYFCCEQDLTNANKKLAYPMLAGHSVIGCGSDLHLSSMANAVKKLYLEEKMSFDEAMGYLQYEYGVLSRRIWSRARFDRIVVYDVLDAEKILILSMAEGEKAVMLQPAMLSKLKSGDRFYRDAVLFAMKKAQKVYVVSEDKDAFTGGEYGGAFSQPEVVYIKPEEASVVSAMQEMCRG